MWLSAAPGFPQRDLGGGSEIPLFRLARSNHELRTFFIGQRLAQYSSSARRSSPALLDRTTTPGLPRAPITSSVIRECLFRLPGEHRSLLTMLHGAVLVVWPVVPVISLGVCTNGSVL